MLKEVLALQQYTYKGRKITTGGILVEQMTVMLMPESLFGCQSMSHKLWIIQTRSQKSRMDLVERLELSALLAACVPDIRKASKPH